MLNKTQIGVRSTSQHKVPRPYLSDQRAFHQSTQSTTLMLVRSACFSPANTEYHNHVSQIMQRAFHQSTQSATVMLVRSACIPPLNTRCRPCWSDQRALHQSTQGVGRVGQIMQRAFHQSKQVPRLYWWSDRKFVRKEAGLGGKPRTRYK